MAADITAVTARVMREMNLVTVGRTVGLDRVFARVQACWPDASRAQVWEAVLKIAEDECPDDEVTYEDCIDEVWGSASEGCW